MLQNVTLRGIFLLCFWWNFYQSVLTPQNLPALKNVSLCTCLDSLQI